MNSALNGQPLKQGYSTGACAAAAAQAAMRRLQGEEDCFQVSLRLPRGDGLEIPVERAWKTSRGAAAQVRKNAGDDPDVTHGTLLVAEVRLTEGGGIVIDGGTGVGRATKVGLPLNPGEAAINPVPRQMIRQAVEGFLQPGQGVEVTISVPDGERLARWTMNPRLGIIGGISILGTSGLVRPMSLEAWVESLLPQLEQARAYNHEILALTPGGSGEKAALRLGAPLEAIIQCSNFFDSMLEACAERGFKAVVLVGQMGKMSKLAGGVLNTHSRYFRQQVDILAELALQSGFNPGEIEHFRAAATVAEAIASLDAQQTGELASAVASAAVRNCQRAVDNRLEAGCIITGRQGQVLGFDDRALRLWRKLSCQELSK